MQGNEELRKVAGKLAITVRLELAISAVERAIDTMWDVDTYASANGRDAMKGEARDAVDNLNAAIARMECCQAELKR